MIKEIFKEWAFSIPEILEYPTLGRANVIQIDNLKKKYFIYNDNTFKYSVREFYMLKAHNTAATILLMILST